MTPLQVAIQESGIRQNWLAQQLGVTDWQMSRWATGKVTPGKQNRRKLARLLNRSEAELFPAAPEAAA